MKIVLLVSRVICYAALTIVLAGAFSLFAPFLLDLCKVIRMSGKPFLSSSNQTGGTIKCTAPFYRSMFEFGFTIVMMSVYTGLPAILACAWAGRFSAWWT